MFGAFKSPCKDCTKRKLGCHGSCDLYLAAKKDAAEINSKLEKDRETDAYYVDKIYKRGERWRELEKKGLGKRGRKAT